MKKEITEIDIDMDTKAFESWWDNEAANRLLKDNDPISSEQYINIYSIAKEAWLNGAYKAREFNW